MSRSVLHLKIAIRLLDAKYLMLHDKNSHFLTAVYSIIKSLNLCESQYAFSRLCGRNPSWFSAAKCLGLPLSTDVALRLLLKLQNYAAKPDLPTAKKEDAEYLCEILRNIVQTRLTS